MASSKWQTALGIPKTSAGTQSDQASPDAAQISASSSVHKVTTVILLLYSLFIFYMVAIPFQLEWTRSSLRHHWKRAECIPFLNSEHKVLSLGDAVGNILLFVPFGFLLHLRRLNRGTPESAGHAGNHANTRPSLLAALLYSGTIELMQLFLNGRNTSINDVINNVVGAYMGIRLARAYPGLLAVAMSELKRFSRTRPVFMLWLATLLLQTLLALAPFDFTLKLENFQRQWLRWQYSWQALPELWQLFPSTAEWLYRFPHQEQLRTTLVITCGCAFWLGMLSVFCGFRYWPQTSRIFRRIIFISLGFYPFLSLLQFTVQSIHPFVLFPLTGILGLMAGMLLMGVFFLLTRLRRQS
ncbi:MAG: VanZ family protein [candidate division KSB1 bacterium]|nr:VanZ family protein [candidate division KSB1 bacterium]MDZ7302107.1 VanZ family protein [candidate division KSB1 bacterium]MDZ7311148.1 VanZ family protein [candidate division KSB1 bacterium]